MAAVTAADSVINALTKGIKQGDSRYIRPELYSLRKPLNTLLITVAALAAYPQIIGQDKLNCIPHVPCDNTTELCSSREDRHIISDMSYNHKLFVDDDCRKTHMSQYRFYLLYILIGVAVLNIIIQRLWRVVPSHNVFVSQFLKTVEDCEDDVGVHRLMSKLHMPKHDDSESSECQVEENIQVIEHFLHFDDDLRPPEKQKLINLIDKAIDLKSASGAKSVGVSAMSMVTAVIHFILSVVFLIASNLLEDPIFEQEFFCLHPSFDGNSNRILCIDLQAKFLTSIRFVFQILLLCQTLARMIQEFRVQVLVHWTHGGNVQQVLRYKMAEKKTNFKDRRHGDLLFLMVCLKLYDQKLFNAVSLLMSEQMNEVRRRQKRNQLIRHLQSVVRGGKLGCLRHFIRQLRLMHVPDTDGRLQDIVAEKGDVEVNLTDDQFKQFRSCLNAVVSAEDGEKLTALHRSVQSGQPEVVEHLLNAGAEINVKDAQEETALHKAVRWKMLPVIEVLLRRKADITAKNKEGKSPVELGTDDEQKWDIACLCIRTGLDVDLITTVLDQGVPLDHVRADVGTLLHVAVLKNSSRIIRLLLDRGANPKILNHKQQTPLQMAVAGASLKVVKMLLLAEGMVSKEEVELLQELASKNDRSAVSDYLLNYEKEMKRSSTGDDDDEMMGRAGLFA